MNLYPEFFDAMSQFIVGDFCDDFGNAFTISGDALWSYIYFCYGSDYS